MNLKLAYILVSKTKTSLLLRLFPQQYNKLLWWAMGRFTYNCETKTTRNFKNKVNCWELQFEGIKYITKQNPSKLQI
jgi:hypothetical protein